ncbi:MAG: hypothetical protein RL226_1646 [Bacteroidota bacterium]
MKLSESQHRAIQEVSDYAAARKDRCMDTTAMILHQSNIARNVFKDYCDLVVRHARIALHFHPDRIFSTNMDVLDGMLLTGTYKNQFETNISAGSVSAYTGGNRDIWEQEIFKGAYRLAKPAERPKYGSLNLTKTNHGPSPRFGSCYFLLKPEVKNRATFCYGDSYDSPTALGTIEDFHLIHAAVLNDVFTRGTALGEKDMMVSDFLDLMIRILPDPISAKNLRKNSNNLDFYIEAQVHGDVFLHDDVDSLVADSSYRGTNTANRFEELCEKYAIELIWNSGLELDVSRFPNNFRGPEIPSVAEKLGVDGKLNAYLIGEASKQMNCEHQQLQMLKYLWHCIVRFGKDIEMPTSDLQPSTI